MLSLIIRANNVWKLLYGYRVDDRNATAKGITRTCLQRPGTYLLLQEKHIIFAESAVRRWILLLLWQVNATDISIIGYKAKACRSSLFDMRTGIRSRTREMLAIKRRCVRSYPRMLLHKRVSIGTRICYVRVAKGDNIYCSPDESALCRNWNNDLQSRRGSTRGERVSLFPRRDK